MEQNYKQRKASTPNNGQQTVERKGIRDKQFHFISFHPSSGNTAKNLLAITTSNNMSTTASSPQGAWEGDDISNTNKNKKQIQSPMYAKSHKIEWGQIIGWRLTITIKVSRNPFDPHHQVYSKQIGSTYTHSEQHHLISNEWDAVKSLYVTLYQYMKGRHSIYKYHHHQRLSIPIWSGLIVLHCNANHIDTRWRSKCNHNECVSCKDRQCRRHRGYGIGYRS